MQTNKRIPITASGKSVANYYLHYFELSFAEVFILKRKTEKKLRNTSSKTMKFTCTNSMNKTKKRKKGIPILSDWEILL